MKSIFSLRPFVGKIGLLSEIKSQYLPFWKEKDQNKNKKQKQKQKQKTKQNKKPKPNNNNKQTNTQRKKDKEKKIYSTFPTKARQSLPIFPSFWC